MKTNIFNVREKKQNKIIVEEEKTKNPLLLFFRKNKKMLLIFLILLALSTLLVSVGGAIITIQKSQEFDLSFLNGSKKEITTNNNPTIKDEDVEEELLGPIARHEGVILLTKTFLDSDNNVIYYFSDNSAIIVKSNGKIYRVSPLENGNYGIDEKGNINNKAKKILVKATTSTLKDGTVITYYSDGSAKLEHNGITTFVRDSNNIKLDAGVSLKNVVPSGVSISDNITKKSDITMITYTDKSKQITINNKKYILNSKIDTTVDNENIAYDSNNIFKVRKETILKDGNTITYYENGSAVITDNDNNTIYVKKSGDIVIKNKKIYEIITNKYGYSTITKTTNDNKKVTYFDNGAAIIENKDGTKSYVEDNNDIIYDSVNKIKGSPSQSNQKSVKKTTDGYTVINFENGKSQIIKKDGSSFIIDTSKVIFDATGSIAQKPKNDNTQSKDNKNDQDSSSDNTQTDEDNNTKSDPIEGMYVSDANNKYNDSKSIEDTTFIIRNTNSKQKKYRIVIEEVEDYKKYSASRLEPKFVKFQATIGNNQVRATKLTNETWTDENGKTTYVIYDGTINAQSRLEVALTLYVDYEPLNNTYQNKSFIGTIKVYVNE